MPAGFFCDVKSHPWQPVLNDHLLEHLHLRPAERLRIFREPVSHVGINPVIDPFELASAHHLGSIARLAFGIGVIHTFPVQWQKAVTA